MKNIIKSLSILSAVLVMVSCDTDPDNTIYDVLDFEKGAVLRTISIENNLLNSSNPSSTFSVTVEEQDKEDGGLMESVDVYVRYRDNTPADGINAGSTAFIKSIPASEFTVGPVGLPRATITATYGEATAALGFGNETISAGDILVFELVLNLTDGRSFGPESSNSVLTGVFFKAPFSYNTLITCSPQPGDYLVKLFDSYGDGWQTDDGNGGSGLMIDIDGDVTEVGLCSPYQASEYDCSPALDGTITSDNFFEGEATVTIPEGTESASWTFPGDQYGEIRFEVYSPDGTLVFDSGDFGDTGAGLLPIVVCAE